MLVSVFENTSPVKFSTVLDTTITIPKNATIKLAKAFIPRNHIILIDTTNNSISFNFHNERQTESLNVSLTVGRYGVQQLLTHIESQVAAAISPKGQGQFSDFKLEAEYVRFKGFGEGAVKLTLKGNSIYANFWANLNWSRSDAGNDWITDFVQNNGGVTTLTLNTQDDDLRCAAMEDGGGAAITTWNNSWGLKKAHKRDWFSAVTTPTGAASLEYPENGFPWSGTDFTIANGLIEVGKDNSWWIGVTEDCDSIDMTACTDGNLNQLGDAVGVTVAVAFYGVTANGKSKGDVEIFENIGGTMTSVKEVHFDAPYAPVSGDEFCICIPANKAGLTQHEFNYYVKNNATDSKWRLIAVPPLVNRPKPPETTNLFTCGGFFNSSGVDDTVTNMRWGGNPEMSHLPGIEDTGSGYFDKYGRSGKIWFSGARNNNKAINDELGFSDDVEATSATFALNSTFDSNQDLVHFDGSENQPFINLNITNLPIDSISCDSTDATTRAPGQVFHSSSKTISALPRYDPDGSGLFNTVTIQADAQNEPTVHLDNASEIILNSLDFELRNCDGSVPTDLATPLGLVIEINSSK